MNATGRLQWTMETLIPALNLPLEEQEAIQAKWLEDYEADIKAENERYGRQRIAELLEGIEQIWDVIDAGAMTTRRQGPWVSLPWEIARLEHSIRYYTRRYLEGKE